MSQIERLYWIDTQIRDGHYPNAAAVCHEFGVSRRTAYADRRHLTDNLHAPLETDRRRGGWYYTIPTFHIPFLAFTDRESDTLRRTLLTAQAYLAPPDAALARALAARLQPFLPPLAETPWESIGGAILPADALSPTLIQDCRTAIDERRRLRLTYYSAHNHAVTDRVVHPYSLYYWRGEPYLITWCESRAAMRDFFLGRIRAWTLSAPGAPFVRDPAFDPDTYLRDSFALRHGDPLVTVRLRFSSYQARWIRERLYHPSQQIAELPDGRLELTLTVAGTAEIKRWLLGYGPEVEVLEPSSLRAELAADTKKLCEIYSAPPECSPAAL